MDLPITKNELDIIIEMLKNKNPHLYNKLWSYRFNLKNTAENKSNYGLS